VQGVLCVGADGREAPAEVTRSYPVTVRGACAAVYALTSSGYWTKTVHGTRNVPRDAASAVVDSWLSFEGVKRLDGWGPSLAEPITQDLELVPLEDPLSLAPGDKLHLRATFRGQPRPGVVVAYDGKPRGESDAEGRVNIRLRERGLQLIRAGFSEALDWPKADRVVYATTLVFDLP
jgi:nickel transport protein